MEKKPIALACDHAGYPLKEELKKHLEKRGIAYTDYGIIPNMPICSVRRSGKGKTIWAF